MSFLLWYCSSKGMSFLLLSHQCRSYNHAAQLVIAVCPRKQCYWDKWSCTLDVKSWLCNTLGTIAGGLNVVCACVRACVRVCVYLLTRRAAPSQTHTVKLHQLAEDLSQWSRLIKGV